MVKFLNNIWHSFPVKLVVLHFKRHPVLMLYWALIFLIILRSIGKKLGIPFLLLDPEYMGEVNFISFFIVGIAFGTVVMSWNITTYILHAFRFPFLATLKRPFMQYCINNALIPLALLITYFVALIKFQSQSEFKSTTLIIVDMFSFIAGVLALILFAILYFYFTNKDIFSFLGIQKKEDIEQRRKHMAVRVLKEDEEEVKGDRNIRVDFYIMNLTNIRRVRNVEHYSPSLLQAVLKQNHANALLVEMIALAVLISLGFLVDKSRFQIPAGASILLLFSILIMITGAFAFWMGRWRTTALIGLLVLLSFLMKYKVIDSTNQAYGLNYNTEPAQYTLAHLQSLTTKEKIDQDKRQMLEVLENWKKKASVNGEKPVMIFINTSGGGLRSALWTLNVLQKLDSTLEGKLMRNTFAISGASGGMVGAAYFRELYWQKTKGARVDLYDPKHTKNISKDILNPVAFALVVSDLFVPWQKFDYNGRTYNKDRGYIFEKKLNSNTNYILNRKISAYAEAEKQMHIPMMIFSPTIINEGRRLYISNLPVGFLTRPPGHRDFFSKPEIDGVEFMSLFKDQDAENLSFTSALRMNATFPYVTPTVYLPSRPVMEVMDAGMRDNLGVEVSMRFLYTFREWIKENTAGVIILQIRDNEKEKTRDQKEMEAPTLLDKWFSPISNFYENWNEFQDFYHDNLLGGASALSDIDLDVIRFEYIPRSAKEEVSLSWHLTTKEKNTIIHAIRRSYNQKAIDKMRSALHK